MRLAPVQLEDGARTKRPHPEPNRGEPGAFQILASWHRLAALDQDSWIKNSPRLRWTDDHIEMEGTVPSVMVEGPASDDTVPRLVCTDKRPVWRCLLLPFGVGHLTMLHWTDSQDESRCHFAHGKGDPGFTYRGPHGFSTCWLACWLVLLTWY